MAATGDSFAGATAPAVAVEAVSSEDATLIAGLVRSAGRATDAASPEPPL